MQSGLNIWAAEEITLSKTCPLALFILMRKLLPNAMFFSECFGYNEFIALRVNFLHFRTGPHINVCRQAPYVNLQLPNIQGIKIIENPGVNWLTQRTSQWNALTLHFTRFLPDLFPMRARAGKNISAQCGKRNRGDICCSYSQSTQALLQKSECMRMYSWTEITFTA